MPYITVPVAGMTADEAVMGDWYVSVGEAVSLGQELCSITFEKVDVSLEADVAGTVVELLVAAGDVLRPGQRIAEIADG